jgi:hypothetical protein
VVAFRDAIERAISIGRKRIAVNPRDADGIISSAPPSDCGPLHGDSRRQRHGRVPRRARRMTNTKR